MRWKTLTFQVDAALLRELGERLVGKPYVALAELIKNSYDADATLVELTVRPDRIVVADNGHGMDLRQFSDFWMRIGSPHKEKLRRSPNGRSLTGQKGIGRLAVQFLGRKLDLVTQTGPGSRTLRAKVDWDAAHNERELSAFPVQYEESQESHRFPQGSARGTAITITGLSQSWTEDEIKELALEVWSLQTPFETTSDESGFAIAVVDAPLESIKTFRAYAEAFRTLWSARITGSLEPPSAPGGAARCVISTKFSDGTDFKYTQEIQACTVENLRFDIAIYSPEGKQQWGVTVGELRDYLREHGGVGIFDAGFRLPFYGVESDWLAVQLDHSRRLSESQLLPKELQVARGMNFLPTNARVLGAVHVDTGAERRWIERSGNDRIKPLQIAITRDRLIENPAFETIRKTVRAALDFYAMREAERQFKEAAAKRDVDRTTSAVDRIGQVVERYADKLPSQAVKEIKRAVDSAVEASRVEREFTAKQANLLGALATSGMAAAAMEHEASRNLRRLEAIPLRLRRVAERAGAQLARELREMANEIQRWIDETRSSRRLLADVADPSSRDNRNRLRARAIVDDVVGRMASLVRGVDIDTSGVEPDLRLPAGSFVEWSSVFQNVIANACNATLDSDVRRIVMLSRSDGKNRSLVIQDTGIGVDLDEAETLFEPFVQKLEVSYARQGLRIGGSGLGLAIVKMISANLGCRVTFIKPEPRFSTAFELSWSESK